MYSSKCMRDANRPIPSLMTIAAIVGRERMEREKYRPTRQPLTAVQQKY